LKVPAGANTKTETEPWRLGFGKQNVRACFSR